MSLKILDSWDSLGSHLDQTYVNKFLKEIDEIETINTRADKYIEDRTFET